MKLIELPDDLQKLSINLEPYFLELTNASKKIKDKLQEYADEKLLKGDEIVGWLGEVYGKLLLNGKLVSDNFDYDMVAQDKYVSIKARKGTDSGWNQTSNIPKIQGHDCPTHLMFIQFTDDYKLLRVWLFPWGVLHDNKRFVEKIVRGQHAGYYVRINLRKDKNFLIYSRDSSE